MLCVLARALLWDGCCGILRSQRYGAWVKRQHYLQDLKRQDPSMGQMAHQHSEGKDKPAAWLLWDWRYAARTCLSALAVRAAWLASLTLLRRRDSCLTRL